MKINFFSLLQKLNILSLLSIEQSYFKTVTLKAKKKFSKNVVEFNYLEFSPYKNTKIVFNTEKDCVNLWYTDKKIDTPIIIPEAYILTQELRKKDDNALYHFSTYPNKLIVIKDGFLKYQLSKGSISKYEILLLQKELSIANSYEYTQNEYANLLKQALDKLSFSLLIKFIFVELNYKTLFNLILKKISIPLALVVVFLILTEAINNYYLKQQLDTTESSYGEIRQKTKEIRDSVYILEDASQRYAQLDKELSLNKRFLSTLDGVSSILEEHNSSFNFIRLSQSEFRMKIDTNETATLFSDLVKSGNLTDLRIQSSRKARYSHRDILIITGKIK